MSLEGFAIGAVAVIAAVLVIYLIARVGTSAYFRSKQDYEKRK